MIANRYAGKNIVTRAPIRHQRRRGSGRNSAVCLPMCAVALGLFASIVGCKTYHTLPQTICNNTKAIDAIMREVDAGAPPPACQEVPAPPITLRSPEEMDNVSYRELTLQEAIHIALQNSRVLRDLGLTILQSPGSIFTDESKPLVETNPQESIEAALSAFDAQFYALGKFQNNDRKFNNRFFGGGANAFKQDVHDYVFQMSKRTATGTQFAARSVTDYDSNNATGNLTDSAWQTQLHAEVRKPLLQGGGLEFNRIAGPGAQPGQYNGVLIAKVRNDIQGSAFEEATRDYISNVINAYWDLYFAYRNLDAKRAAMERARQTWQGYQAQRTSNRASAAAEALAREQFYRFESDYLDAVAGVHTLRTFVNNTSSGGTFAGQPGVQAAERRFRLLIGLPLSDDTLLRPVDEPLDAPIVFDWESITAEAIRLRVELEQQRLLVKQREMEILAARNFLMPSLDFVGIYRIRGLDKRLAGHDSAFLEFARLDFQEYEGSLEMKLPVGFRQAHLAVRNARLKLARDKALLHAQEQQVLHDLTAVVAECDRAYEQIETNMNRFLAASDAVAALEANRRAGLPIDVEQLLDAQRRVADSQVQYYVALVEYTIAAKNVEFEKGTLLESISLFIVDETSPLALPGDAVISEDAADLGRLPEMAILGAPENDPQDQSSGTETSEQ